MPKAAAKPATANRTSNAIRTNLTSCVLCDKLISVRLDEILASIDGDSISLRAVEW